MTVAKGLPKGASILLDFISSIEAPQGYETIYGNNQGKLKRPITQMTLDQVEAAQPTWTKRFGSSACGAYQFMRNTLDAPGTLRDIEGEMGLTGEELFDPELQDLMGYHLLKRRGYLKFMAGTLSTEAFGLSLAREWASFPVLKRVKGAHRTVNRGQSYYAGDGVNKSLVKPEEVEKVLARVATAGDGAPKPRRPEPVIEDDDYELPVPRPRADRASARYTDRATVEGVQENLWNLGYTEVGSRDPKTGRFDGRIGTLTRTAILAFRNENDLPVVDYIDDELLSAIETAQPRQLAPERTEATPAEVREKVPEVKANFLAKAWAWFLGVGGAGGLAVSGAGDADPDQRGFFKTVMRIFADVPGWMWCALIIVVAVAIIYTTQKGQKAGEQAYQTGARR